MPHPVMFRDDDFGLAEVRRIALAFPGAFEKISHGRPVFYAPKSFVWYGGSSKQSGAVMRYDHAIIIKPAEAPFFLVDLDRAGQVVTRAAGAGDRVRISAENS